MNTTKIIKNKHFVATIVSITLGAWIYYYYLHSFGMLSLLEVSDQQLLNFIKSNTPYKLGRDISPLTTIFKIYYIIIVPIIFVSVVYMLTTFLSILIMSLNSKKKRGKTIPIIMFIKAYKRYLTLKRQNKNPEYPYRELKGIKLPPFPIENFNSEDMKIVYGEIHTDKGLPVKNPRYLVVNEEGLFASSIVLGAPGTGKTTSLVMPTLMQLLYYQRFDTDNKCGGIVLEPKGDMAGKLEEIMIEAGREDDLLVFKVGNNETDINRETRLNKLIAVLKTLVNTPNDNMISSYDITADAVLNEGKAVENEIPSIQNDIACLNNVEKGYTKEIKDILLKHYEDVFGKKDSNNDSNKETITNSYIYNNTILRIVKKTLNYLKKHLKHLESLNAYYLYFEPINSSSTAYDKTLNINQAKMDYICGDKHSFQKLLQLAEKRLSKAIKPITYNFLYNPKQYPEELAKSISLAIKNVQAAMGMKSGGNMDPFWDQSAENLFKIIFASLSIVCKHSYYTINDFLYFSTKETASILLKINGCYLLFAKLEQYIRVKEKIVKEIDKNVYENSIVYELVEAMLKALTDALNNEEIISVLSLTGFSFRNMRDIAGIKQHIKNMNDGDIDKTISVLSSLENEFNEVVINTPANTFGSISLNAKNLLSIFNQPDIESVFCPPFLEDNNFEGAMSSIINEGKVVATNIPESQFKVVCILTSTLLLRNYQSCMEGRVALAEIETINMKRSCFMVVDECQKYVTEKDADFCAVSRQSKSINLYYTQNLGGIERSLGKEACEQFLGSIRSFGFFGLTSTKDSGSLEFAIKTCGEQSIREVITTIGESGQARDGKYTDDRQNINVSENVSEKMEEVFSKDSFKRLEKNQMIYVGFDGIRAMHPLVIYNIPIYYTFFWKNMFKNYNKIESAFYRVEMDGTQVQYNNFEILDKRFAPLTTKITSTN